MNAIDQKTAGLAWLHALLFALAFLTVVPAAAAQEDEDDEEEAEETVRPRLQLGPRIDPKGAGRTIAPGVPSLQPLRVPQVPSIDSDRLKKARDLRKQRSGDADGKGTVAQRKASPKDAGPVGSARKGDDALPKAGDQRWKQVEDEPPGDPTLSTDFIKKCQKLPPGVRFNLDIYDDDLDNIVKLMACLTGRNIIVPKSLKGKKITIYSPQQVTAGEAYRAFLTALEANGFTISRQGKFTKIIEIKDSARHPDPLLSPEATPPNEDRMVTQIVPLDHVDAQEINEVLSKLASGNAQFIVYQPTNTLIITEVASNLRKLLGLIEQLDTPGGKERLWVYEVVHAEAQEIKAKIEEIFETQAASGKKAAPTTSRSSRRKRKKAAPAKPSTSAVGESDLEARVSKIVADERTNRLIIVANERSYRKVKRLIRRLDVAIPGDGQIHIHQLSHAKAEDLANVLSNLQSGQQSGSNRRARSNASRSSAARNNTSGGGGSTSAALFEGEVQITGDEDTNSLVITASLKDYLSLKRVIDVLDRPRRQVFVEAVIMEVSLSNTREFGLSFHSGYDANVGGERVVGAAGFQGGDLSSVAVNPANLMGLAAFGGSESTIELGGIEVPLFGAVLRALASSTDTNVLSTPHILTTDNEEAEIVVGQNVPFIVGTGLGGLGNVSNLANLASNNASNANLGALGALGGGFGFGQQIQRQDVALTLKITPRINAEDFVTLEIEQTVEDIEATDPNLGPTTNKRQVNTTVVVKDQRTVVIGGLQRDVQRQGATKAPIIGEIPIIGYLFRNTNRNAEKRNLLLMLTPYVIESSDDFRTIFKRKMEEQREFLSRFRREGDAYVIGIDYAKKHGALEAINKSLTEARREQDLIEELRLREEGPPLPQDVDGVPLDDPSSAVPADPDDTNPANAADADLDPLPSQDEPPPPPPLD